MQYHPDRNAAGKEMMQAINAAYTALKDYTGDAGQADTDYTEHLSDAINAVLDLAGVEVEVCGCWVWLWGQTKQYKDAIKAAGYKWAPKKGGWYYRPDDYKSYNRGAWSMDKIRDVHGSKGVPRKTKEKIAA